MHLRMGESPSSAALLRWLTKCRICGMWCRGCHPQEPIEKIGKLFT